MKSVGVEMGQKCDFPCRVGDPILPLVESLRGQVDVLIQFYSKPDYFPPDLYLVDIPKVWMLYDLHVHAEELSRSCALFDLIIVPDGRSRERLLALGVDHVEVVPFAVDEKVFYRAQKQHKRFYDVGFSGSVSHHPLLRKRAEWLKNVGERFSLRIENRSLTGAQVADFYQDCRVVINHAVHEDVNMRIMEALMSGRPLVTPWVPSIEDIIQDGVHAKLYHNDQECFEHIAYLLSHPQEAENMALRGQAHALEHFCYEKTSRHLLDILSQYLQVWEQEGPRRKNIGPLKSAQFMYHWFRFPGDALQWLLVHTHGHGFADHCVRGSLKVCLSILRGAEWFRKVRYFQRNE